MPQADGPGGLLGILQRPGVQQGMLATGMALLAQKDRRGSLGGALGRALPSGVQAFRVGQHEDQWEQTLAAMPDGPQKDMLRALGPAAGPQALFQMQQPRVVPEGASILDPVNDTFTTAPARTGAIRPPDLGDDFTRVAMEVASDNPDFLGTLDPRFLTTDQTTAVNSRLDAATIAEARASAGQQEDKFVSGLQEQAISAFRESSDAAQTSRAALTRLESVQRSIGEVAATPYSGFFAGVQEDVDRILADMGLSDGSRAAVTQIRDLFFKTNALDVIQAFPGQLSEKELEAAQFLAGDKRMEETTLANIMEAFQLTNQALIRIQEGQAAILRDPNQRNDPASLVNFFGVTGEVPAAAAGGLDSLIGR